MFVLSTPFTCGTALPCTTDDVEEVADLAPLPFGPLHLFE